MKTIDCTYQARGKQIQMQELADVAAVRAKTTARKSKLSTAALKEIAPDDAAPHVRALESAGWSFVPRKQATDGAKVYLKSGGRVALGTNRLIVRIAGKKSDEQALKKLKKAGFELVETVKFAPGTFVVSTPPGEDPLAAAKRLLDSGAVEFAEPELIEPIGGR